MLNDLVSGKERSRFILLHDNIGNRGVCLLRYITKEFLERLDAVFAFTFDEPATNFEKYFKNEPRLVCHDGFSDPLNWQETCSHSPIHSAFYLKETLHKAFTTDQSFKQIQQISGKPAKIGVVINSLSSLVSQQNVTTLCRDILELVHLKTQGCEVVQTVAMVHGDLHDDGVLASFNYMATTTVEMEPTDSTEDYDGCYTLVHCKKTGKIQRERQCYKIGADLQFKIQAMREKKSGQAGFIETETPAVTSELTFNLNLTEQQKEARSSLQLPYILDERVKKTQLNLGNKGQIFYEADEGDDLDEEDPDDDLNI